MSAMTALLADSHHYRLPTTGTAVGADSPRYRLPGRVLR